MAAAGRLQGETGIQAIAPINRSITDKYPPQLAELGPAAHHGGGKRRAGRTIKVNPKRSGAWGRGLFTSLSGQGCRGMGWRPNLFNLRV